MIEESLKFINYDEKFKVASIDKAAVYISRKKPAVSKKYMRSVFIHYQLIHL